MRLVPNWWLDRARNCAPVRRYAPDNKGQAVPCREVHVSIPYKGEVDMNDDICTIPPTGRRVPKKPTCA